MKKIQLIISTIFLSMSFFGYSQIMTNLNSSDPNITNLSFGLYPDNTIVKSTITSTSGVTNTSPELLINSILSENSLAWMNLNNNTQVTELDADATQDLNKKNTLDKNLNYFQLAQVINFTFKNENYKYIKYSFHNSKSTKKPYGFILMVSKNNKWLRVNEFNDTNSELMNYTLTFFKFNYQKLNAILSKNNLGNSLMTNIINATHKANGFSITSLSQQLDIWNYNTASAENTYFSEALDWE
ncbi:hypothetical protein [Flavobacterium flavipallidum]|uniref:Uncharacterized protein n=1 Tax=Flavobacterium flavipallidum TaxID=3139140 RepID=A0ABU9HN80_9FLAO